LGGELDSPRSALVYGFATDHREVKAGDAFLAIKGARTDGHDFAAEAARAGAVVVVAERPVSAPHILVPNLVDALARFGETLRNSFAGPVIGITGSAGKTTTKEFLACALSPLGSILRTPGNRNTEYTAPLLWANLEPDTAAVVVELAMRGFGQIAHLASFTRPTIGVVTNVGYGHLEMVGSREGIARAKAELIDALPLDAPVILWQGDDFLELLKEHAGSRNVFTFGFEESADCRITGYEPQGFDKAIVTGRVNGELWTATQPALGRHIAINAAAAILVATILNVPCQEAASEIHRAALPPLRMEVREQRGVQIIIDAYNSSPPAVLAAIEALEVIPVRGKRYAVLGEMKELGEHTERLHRAVGQALGELDGALFYGEPMIEFAMPEAIRSGLPWAEAAASLENVSQFLSGLQPGDAVLLKGSRALGLERALEAEAE
jgi:UDP-N-acetylmuramoyl-tripeptide--D-alanyl-D-alanine ligase